MVEQPLQSGRRAVKRHLQLLTQHGHRQVDLLDAGENVRHQVAVLEGAGVPPIRRLVVGGAVDIVEDRPRQPPPRQFAKIVEIITLVQAHDAPRISRSASSSERLYTLPCSATLPRYRFIGRAPNGPTLTGPSRNPV